jgi:hypothetical protein
LGLVAALVNVVEFVVDGARGGVASPFGLLTWVLSLSWVITVGVGLMRAGTPLVPREG